MSGGTFQVSRAVWDHPIFAPSKFSEREAFLWMISAACWENKVVRSGVVVVELERGQLCFSLRFLAERWGWSKTTVSRFLRKLKKRDMIWCESGTGQNLVTIRNYSKYQLLPKSSRDSSGTASGTKAGQQRDSSGTKKNTVNTLNTLNTGNEVKRDTKVSTKKPIRAAQFPDDWMPSQKAMEFCYSKQYDQTQIGQMIEDCVNHHRGKGNTFKDHNAAFRMWASNQIKFHGSPDAQRKKHNAKFNGSQNNPNMANDPALEQIARLARLR